MATTNYTPTPVPNDATPGLKAWLADQLRRIADSLRAPSVSSLVLQPLAAAPARPEEGMLVNADGTNWDPGSGAGVYQRLSGAWVKL